MKIVAPTKTRLPVPSATIAPPMAERDPVRPSPREDIGYGPVEPDAPARPPSEWWSKWDANNQEFWNTMMTHSLRQAFVRFHTRENKCYRCHQPLPYVPSPVLDSFMKRPARPIYCKACPQKEESAAVTLSWWEVNCPAEFQKPWDARAVKCQKATERVLDWKYGPRGLLIHGGTGLGKTRAVWQLLRHSGSLNVTAMTAEAWGLMCSKLMGEDMSKAHEWIEMQCRADILFLDDLDKIQKTERVQADLFHLISTRCSRNLPIIATTNMVGDDLAAKFDPELGAAMVRRFRDKTFFDPVPFYVGVAPVEATP